MKNIKLTLILICLIAFVSCKELPKKNNQPTPFIGMLSNCNSNPFSAMGHSKLKSTKLAPDKDLVWDKKKLTCFFLTDDREFVDTIMTVLQAWENCCGVDFILTDDKNADIRVSFLDSLGCNSEIGKNSQYYKEYPSMNLDPKIVTKNSDYWLINLFVLHEFGHAMGFIHEHQRADLTILWDSACVYKYYECTAGWNRELVDANIFMRYAFDENRASEYDTLSIMHYDFPQFLTKNCKGYLANWTLSESDKKTALACYPK